MNPQVEQAIAELRVCFPDTEVVASDTKDGGASVRIDSVDIGSAYVPKETWIAFGIAFQYPYADVYPLFVRPDLARADGQPHGEGFALGSFEGEPALQLSRRSNHLNAEIDTAALKVTKVIQWLRDQ
ncbi:MAG: hypothetical protein F4X58_06540 [Chloroflexi bacterium]|nr:hypothetical protein [Chloroflexota bacterium]MYC01561.1 hypothetical protein [Chloroflexota bacterium]